jgi:hypothetical protein
LNFNKTICQSTKLFEFEEFDYNEYKPKRGMAPGKFFFGSNIKGNQKDREPIRSYSVSQRERERKYLLTLSPAAGGPIGHTLI